MSSRNVYLSREERAQARALNRALDRAAELVAAGERDVAAIVDRVTAELTAQPLARIDYVELRDATTLAAITRLDAPGVLALAVHFGRTRLIDNRVLDPS